VCSAVEKRHCLRHRRRLGRAPARHTNRYTYVLDGGDKKYYLWNTVSNYVARIEEPNLEEILAKMGSEGVSSIKRTVLAD
jgi:hypothetical protein